MEYSLLPLIIHYMRQICKNICNLSRTLCCCWWTSILLCQWLAGLVGKVHPVTSNVYMIDGRMGSSGYLENLFLFLFELSLRAKVHNYFLLHEASRICLCNPDITMWIILRFCSPELPNWWCSMMVDLRGLTSVPKCWSLQPAASSSYLSSHMHIIILKAIMWKRLGSRAHQPPSPESFALLW